MAAAILDGMSLPRQVLPGSSYLITRRCAGRRFLLRPDAQMNQAFTYCLAVAAQRYDVLVHAAVALSNHYHLVVTDRGGELPEFMRWFNEFVAKCVNVLRNRTEGVWGTGTYSAVRLEGPEDVLAKLVYTLANPTAAGLVRHAREWPGTWLAPGTATSAKRPPFFFRSNGPLPEHGELRLTWPECTSAFGERDRWLEQELKRIGDVVNADLGKAGRTFRGSRAVRRDDPEARPALKELAGRLNPTFAARDRWRREEALRRFRTFLEAYRESWRRWRARQPTVFPAGTYWLRVRAGVPCEDACFAPG